VDYVVYSGHLIMRVEAKRMDLGQGVAQCAIQLDCAGKINKKHERELPERLFGFYFVWTLGPMEKRLRDGLFSYLAAFKAMPIDKKDRGVVRILLIYIL